jgi:hypothetical protein
LLSWFTLFRILRLMDEASSSPCLSCLPPLRQIAQGRPSSLALYPISAVARGLFPGLAVVGPWECPAQLLAAFLSLSPVQRRESKPTRKALVAAAAAASNSQSQSHPSSHSAALVALPPAAPHLGHLASIKGGELAHTMPRPLPTSLGYNQRCFPLRRGKKTPHIVLKLFVRPLCKPSAPLDEQVFPLGLDFRGAVVGTYLRVPLSCESSPRGTSADQREKRS